MYYPVRPGAGSYPTKSVWNAWAKKNKQYKKNKY